MDVGNVLSEAFALYRRHWQHFIPIALIYYLVLSLATLALTVALGVVGALLAAVVSLVGVFWLQGTLTEAVADVRDGRADLSIGETFRRVAPRIGALLAAGILAVLGIMVGLVLLIVPGLILLTWWSVLVPAVVLERRGVFEAFGRSRELVRGNGWAVFGVIVITLLIGMVVGIVLGIAFAWAPEEVGTFVGDVIGGTLTAPFAALAWTLMYYHLRRDTPAPAGALAGAESPEIPEQR